MDSVALFDVTGYEAIVRCDRCQAVLEHPYIQHVGQCRGCDACCTCTVCVHCDTRVTFPCDTCDKCMTCCECVVCDNRYCEERVETVCSNCSQCDDCCECVVCARSRCSEIVDSVCDRCEWCEHCCECAYCERGDHKCEWTCSECDGCDDCCDCWYCDACSENHRYNVDRCSDCESCLETCDCESTPDSEPALDPAVKIYDYSTNVLRYCAFRGTPRDMFYLGTELEMVVREGNKAEHVKRIYDLLQGYGILKYDGSVSNGFELVTSPWSLEEHQEFWPSAISQLLPGLVSWNTDCCGMHVHISRAPLDAYTLGKLQVFINSPLNRTNVVKIAGRNNSDYAKFTNKTLDNGSRYNSDRYEAINLQNKNTAEFRIFKGTLHTQHILANLEFVESVTRWACGVTPEHCESWAHYWDYVQEQATRYSNLRAYMGQK